jgi:hypothetical protein
LRRCTTLVGLLQPPPSDASPTSTLATCNDETRELLVQMTGAQLAQKCIVIVSRIAVTGLSALVSSAWLVLMVLPDAARSPWVDREVAWWRENKSPQRT